MGRKHNLENPKCPDCQGITTKLGFLVFRDGKIRRYHCIECGRSFSDNTLDVRIEDIPRHLEQVL